MENLNDRHNAKYILSILRECLSELDIEDKILSWVLFFFLDLSYYYLFIYLRNTNSLFNRITSDKASENISLLKLFKNHYIENYNSDLSSLECVAHTINNIVQDILSWLLWEEKDKRLIHNTINENLIEEEELQESNKG